MNKILKKIGYLLKCYFNKSFLFFRESPNITILLVFSFFMSSFLFMYMNLPVLSSADDHYFHFRFAENLINNGFFNSFRDFKTLAFTGIAHGEHLLYYNFLFYLVLIPFTYISPLFLAIKLYAIIVASLIGVIIFFFLRKIEIKYSFLWTVGFFAVIGLGSFWRLFLSRPFVLSPLIILLLVLALHKRKFFWIFILSFLPLFWHTSTFFVPILVAGVYFIVNLFYKKEFLWKEILLVFLGMSTAILTAFFIDHGFFISIRDNLFSVLSGVLNFSGNGPNISEGSEVYPRNFFDLFNQNILLCTLFVFSIIAFVGFFLKEIKNISDFNQNKMSRRIISTVFFLLSSVFIIAIPNISYRFSDFFIFFGWIFCVLVINEFFSYIIFNDLNFKKFFTYAIFISVLYLFLNNVLQINDIFASNGSYPETFSQVGNYLAKNLKKDDIVFDLNWSWFPQLYYYAPEQDYVIGLEPKLTYLYDQKLYWVWANIRKGYICEKETCPDLDLENSQKMRNNKTSLFWVKEKGNEIADVVINDFKSHYIVSSGDYPQFNNILNKSKRFERVLNSRDQYFIYKILPPVNAK